MTDLTRQAFDQARWLDHGCVGLEHFLLALLAEPSAATEALAELHLTYDRFVNYIRNQVGNPGWPSPRYDPEMGLTGPNPAGHQLMSCVEGFAAAWRHRSPAPERWLLPMVYADNMVASELDHFGVSP
jgi:hypothetical protein